MYCKIIISKIKKVYTKMFLMHKIYIENKRKKVYYKNFTKIKNICKKTLDLNFYMWYYYNCTEEIS